MWRYILANSAKDVLNKYPKLTILDQEPDWFTDELRQVIRTVDIDDPPGEFLMRMRTPEPRS